MGASADGSIVVGSDGRPIHWTTKTGTGVLGPLPGGNPEGAATGVSADGSVIVGWTVDQVNRQLAVVWNASGAPYALGPLAEGEESEADAVTPDGHIVAGTSHALDGSAEPFRWETSTGLVKLGDVLGGTHRSFASAISSDGRVICGQSELESGPAQASCWTEETGIVTLPNLPDAGEEFPGRNRRHLSGRATYVSEGSTALGANADGSVIVGFASKGDTQVAVLWDASDGVHAIAERLRALGVDMGGWELDAASAVTPDGQTVVGWGFSPQGSESAWIAVLSRGASTPQGTGP